MARWLDAGASPRLWMNNQPPGCVGCLLEPRRGLISWHHQGTARLSVAEDAGAAARLRGWAAPSGHRGGCNKLAASQEPTAAINAIFEPQKADIVLFFAYCLLIEKIK